ncbi:MAG: hypothetical protein E7480_07235 [Ruminococcaceae bacterium]|nr:hypothetical protein [Oscillospiraceae bacterium]
MKRAITLATVLAIIMSLALTFGISASAEAVSGWETVGTNVTVTANGTAAQIDFNAAYNWGAEYAHLPNKLAPVAPGEFAFRFKATNLAGGWVPFVLCWSASPNGSLHSNGIFFNVTNGNIEVRDGADTAPANVGAIANKAIDTNVSHLLKIKLVDAATGKIDIYIDGELLVSYNSMSMANQLGFDFALVGLEGLTLTVGGGGNCGIIIDTNTTDWETVGNTSAVEISGAYDKANLKFTAGDHMSVYTAMPNKFAPMSTGVWTYGFNVKSLEGGWASIVLNWSVDSVSPILASTGIFASLSAAEGGFVYELKNSGTSDAVTQGIGLEYNKMHYVTLVYNEPTVTAYVNGVNIGSFENAQTNYLGLEFPFAGNKGLTLSVAGGGAFEMEVDTAKYNNFVQLPENTIAGNVIYGFTLGQAVDSFFNSAVLLGNSSIRVLEDEAIARTGLTVEINSNGTVSTYKTVVAGDVYGDGKIELIDILYAKSYLLSSAEISAESVAAINVNNDSATDVLDLIAIRNYVLTNA